MVVPVFVMVQVCSNCAPAISCVLLATACETSDAELENASASRAIELKTANATKQAKVKRLDRGTVNVSHYE